MSWHLHHKIIIHYLIHLWAGYCKFYIYFYLVLLSCSTTVLYVLLSCTTIFYDSIFKVFVCYRWDQLDRDGLQPPEEWGFKTPFLQHSTGRSGAPGLSSVVLWVDITSYLCQRLCQISVSGLADKYRTEFKVFVLTNPWKCIFLLF